MYIYILYTSSEARLWRASLLWRTVDSVLAKACFRVVTCKASMHITIEFLSHACMYMNLPMRVRSIITFTVLIQMLMIACIERCEGVIWRDLASW